MFHGNKKRTKKALFFNIYYDLILNQLHRAQLLIIKVHEVALNGTALHIDKAAMYFWV
jgi:hypothetical protein